MITPFPDQPDVDDFDPFANEEDEVVFPDSRERVRAILGPHGDLAEVFKDRGGEYESRPQQLQMAEAVAESMAAGEHLVVEAGTGVGKSFAYLTPLILGSLATGRKVVVSTYTISLQEQVLQKDIPRLSEALGRDIKAVLVKGRGNYLCLRRLALARRNGGDLFRPEEKEWIERLSVWSRQTEDGSVQSLPEQPPPAVWAQVCAEEGMCMYPKQRDHKDCFLTRARQQMQEADILIVNHALFFADLAMRDDGGGILPGYDVVVLDEAHQAEDVAGQSLGLRLTPYSFQRWTRSLYSPENRKGLLSLLKKGGLAHDVEQVRSAVDQLFVRFLSHARFGEHDQSTVRLREPLDWRSPVSTMIRRICKELQDIELELEPGDIQAEVALARRRGADLAMSLDSFMLQTEKDAVYWLEWEGAHRKRVVLNGAPVDVGTRLQAMLFEKLHCVVMTSATLAVDDSLRYFRQRMGAETARELMVGSPFDYARQMRVIAPGGMPDPNDREYGLAVARKAEQYIHRSNGAAFVLFTSVALLNEVVNHSRESLEADGFTCCVQGRDLARHELLQRFIEEDRSVLFGVNSFWMGVDVPGNDLTNVIITKLPFAVPDHPLTQARMESISAQGGNAFKDYSLPEAVIKFKQGVGRLIRGHSDEGIIVLLDPRIQNKWYGRWFRKALPECVWETDEDY